MWNQKAMVVISQKETLNPQKHQHQQPTPLEPVFVKKLNSFFFPPSSYSTGQDVSMQVGVVYEYN